MLDNLTDLQVQVVQSEIVNYLEAEALLERAKSLDEPLTVQYLHYKTIRIFDEVCGGLPISREWLLEQINYNSENKILKRGGVVTFKN